MLSMKGHSPDFAVADTGFSMASYMSFRLMLIHLRLAALCRMWILWELTQLQGAFSKSFVEVEMSKTRLQAMKRLLAKQPPQTFGKH